MTASSRSPRLVLGLLCIAGLAACTSTPQREAQWVDPGLNAQSRLLQGQRVLVGCEVYDVVLRAVCQDRLAREVAARGAIPVPIPRDVVLLADRPFDAQLLGAAAAAGAKAIFTMTMTPATSGGGSGLSLGIGGFSLGRSGGAGVGLGIPIGGGSPSIGFAANGRVTEVQGGRLIWTATLVARPSANLETQFSELSEAVVDAAQGAGVF